MVQRLHSVFYPIYLVLWVAWRHVGITRGSGVWAEGFASTDSQSYIFLIAVFFVPFLLLVPTSYSRQIVGCKC